MTDVYDRGDFGFDVLTGLRQIPTVPRWRSRGCFDCDDPHTPRNTLCAECAALALRSLGIEIDDDEDDDALTGYFSYWYVPGRYFGPSWTKYWLHLIGWTERNQGPEQTGVINFGIEFKPGDPTPHSLRLYRQTVMLARSPLRLVWTRTARSGERVSVEHLDRMRRQPELHDIVRGRELLLNTERRGRPRGSGAPPNFKSAVTTAYRALMEETGDRPTQEEFSERFHADISTFRRWRRLTNTPWPPA